MSIYWKELTGRHLWWPAWARVAPSWSLCLLSKGHKITSSGLFHTSIYTSFNRLLVSLYSIYWPPAQDSGADLSVQNKDGWTALHVAARTDDVTKVELLLRKSFSTLFLVGTNGRSIMHTVCLKNSVSVLEFLLDHGSTSEIGTRL